VEKTNKEIVLPILPILAASIAATQTGDLAYLVTELGQPWTKESFGNWSRVACTAAKCPGTAHGLRKAGATRAAENGATEKQLMALFGWTSGRMATHYTKKASQKRLAKEAAHLLLDAQTQNKTPAPPKGGAGEIAKIL
jgi:integrase